jgi:hypothetical protein
MLSLWLHDATASADPLGDPWRIARADPVARLRSADLARRRGGAYAILCARLDGEGEGVELERRVEDDALLALLATETDLSARLTALAALALPSGRDARAVVERVEALRLPELGPPALALAALHALGSPEAQLDAARARGGVVPDDDLAAVALDALAARPDASLDGRGVEEPLRWRILAARRDPSAAAAIVAELVRASVEVRGGRGMSAIRAARSLRLAEASTALLAIARSGPERALRREAVDALGDVGGVTDDDLAALLDDPAARGPAMSAIGRLRAVRAAPAVRRYAEGDDPGDRRDAEAALAALRGAEPTGATAPAARGGHAASLRRALLTEVDEALRLGAAMALARLDGPGALRTLRAARAVAWSRGLLDGLSLAIELARSGAEP